MAYVLFKPAVCFSDTLSLIKTYVIDLVFNTIPKIVFMYYVGSFGFKAFENKLGAV